MLVSKDDCPLCDTAKEALEHAFQKVPSDLETRKIEEDEELERVHKLEVPVIFIDGVKRFFGRIEVRALVRELRIASRRKNNPAPP